jgi:hypothetical protein
MERVGRKTVLLVKVAISTGHRKIEDMQGGLAGDKVDVAVGTSRNNKEKIPRTCKNRLMERLSCCFNNHNQDKSNREQERRRS